MKENIKINDICTTVLMKRHFLCIKPPLYVLKIAQMILPAHIQRNEGIHGAWK
jgi:hypothetical protein